VLPPTFRCILAGLLLGSALSARTGAGAEPASVIAGHWRELVARQSAPGADRDGIRQRLHQLRNFEAMVSLIGRIEVELRPRRITYLASGAHLAPLALCELLPPDSPCELLFTEIDAGVQGAIDEALLELARDGGLSELHAGVPIEGPGRRRWSFRLAGRPVTLDLWVEDAPGETRLLRTELLEDTDLLISHDWSGDPLVNLGVVYHTLRACRELDRPRAPLLMIEDLERHPYPIDLSPFSPAARTREAYGHRAADGAVGRHGEVELGQPLFGGAVLLGFSDRWWKRVDEDELGAVLDLLLLGRFDTERQNVLEGGEDPLIAPALLDWYTGFGARTIDGGDLVSDPGLRAHTVRRVVAALPEMQSEHRKRMQCHLQLYRCLLEARSASANIRELMPSAELRRRPAPGAFPTPTMERLHREAVRATGRYRKAKEAERTAVTELLGVFDEAPVARALDACPVSEPEPGEDAAEAWAAAYREVLGRLGVPISAPEPEPVAVTGPGGR
jgi:hypothetical protein